MEQKIRTRRQFSSGTERFLPVISKTPRTGGERKPSGCIEELVLTLHTPDFLGPVLWDSAPPSLFL